MLFKSHPHQPIESSYRLTSVGASSCLTICAGRTDASKRRGKTFEPPKSTNCCRLTLIHLVALAAGLVLGWLPCQFVFVKDVHLFEALAPDAPNLL